MIDSRICVVVLVLLHVSVSGCGTLEMYEGEPLPDEQVAYVYRDTPAYQWSLAVAGGITIPIGLLLMIPAAWGDQETSIRGVDGREVGVWSAMCNTRAAVLPGYHTFKVGVRRHRETVSLQCKEGHRYQLQAYNPWNGDPTFVWAIDLDAKELVAGRAPEEVVKSLERQQQKIREREEERDRKEKEVQGKREGKVTQSGSRRHAKEQQANQGRKYRGERDELDELLDDL